MPTKLELTHVGYGTTVYCYSMNVSIATHYETYFVRKCMNCSCMIRCFISKVSHHAQSLVPITHYRLSVVSYSIANCFVCDNQLSQCQAISVETTPVKL